MVRSQLVSGSAHRPLVESLMPMVHKMGKTCAVSKIST